MDFRNRGKAMCSRVLTAIRLKLMGSPDPKIIVLVACHNERGNALRFACHCCGKYANATVRLPLTSVIKLSGKGTLCTATVCKNIQLAPSILLCDTNDSRHRSISASRSGF